jgi:hypothetical protein
MTSYRVVEGAALVLRVDDGPWQTLVLDASSVPDATATDAGELEMTGAALADAIGAFDGVTGAVDDDGRLVLATVDTGESTVLELDREASTAAAALGLGTGAVTARGQGPGSANVTSANPGPYALAPEVSMTLHVDGKSRKVTFDEEGHEAWSAQDVAARINRQLRRKVARATGDGHVRVTSPTQGVGSSVVLTGRAADVLGFIGEAASSDPYRTEPARLVCRPAADTAVVVENLTAAPIELQLPTGRIVLPARGRLAVARDTAADGLLRRLVTQGMVRMSPERNS